jgi:hypothetical protein
MSRRWHPDSDCSSTVKMEEDGAETVNSWSPVFLLPDDPEGEIKKSSSVYNPDGRGAETVDSWSLAVQMGAEHVDDGMQKKASSDSDPDDGAVDEEPGSASASADELTTPVIDAALVTTGAGPNDNYAQLGQRLQAAKLRAADADWARQEVANRNRRRRPGLWIADLARNINKKQYLFLIVVLGIIFILVIALIGVCESKSSGDRFNGLCGRTRQQATDPVPPTRAQLILNYINEITLTGRTLRYPDDATPEGRAIQWLIDEALDVSPSDRLALRRGYALTALWFQTTTTPTHKSTWTCSDNSTDPYVLSDNFTDIVALLNNNCSQNGGPWATTFDECAWEGVSCDRADRVTGLRLGYEIRGRIPDDLGLLTSLLDLDLSFCQLSGTIPSSLGALTSLAQLTMGNNALTGPIPSSLGSLTELWFLSLANNTLTGPIPSSLGALTSLGWLALNDNLLTGTVPSSLGALMNLTSLQLGNNLLTGIRFTPGWATTTETPQQTDGFVNNSIPGV